MSGALRDSWENKLLWNNRHILRCADLNIQVIGTFIDSFYNSESPVSTSCITGSSLNVIDLMHFIKTTEGN